MFKGLGTWLGLETAAKPTQKDPDPDRDRDRDPDPGQDQDRHRDPDQDQDQDQEEPGVEAQNEVNKAPPGEQDAEPTAKQEPGLSDYIFNFATHATKKISESVAGTAQTIKRSVEEGSIDGIIDKDRRNFLRDPPAGVQFHFDMEHMSSLACIMLEEDQLLNRMRFDLVPKLVKEDVFWRNYFYRVSLVKQSAQLTALAAQQKQQQQQQQQHKKEGGGEEERGAGVSPEEVILTENMRPKTPPVSIGDKQKPAVREEEEEISTSPGVSEFVSDAFDSSAINQEDLRKEMEQLVLDKAKTPSPDEEPADWEKELQQELQEYEVVTESDNKDDEWDQEIEKMLQDS
ncbi:hypothetical protein CRUP_025891 [Coryphaenoides rupestris]|nr:hypothetical protein CRUP_025891 [Coryphaenoides rupestris]